MKRVIIRLDSSSGIGKLECVGYKTYNCGGRVGYPYVTDVTIHPEDASRNEKQAVHHSNQYDVDMYYSVLFNWEGGIFIHEWDSLYGSAGCIHLLSGDAEEFYNWVDCPTNIRLEWI